MNRRFFSHHGTTLQFYKGKAIGVFSLSAKYISAVSSLVSRDQPDWKTLLNQ